MTETLNLDKKRVQEWNARLKEFGAEIDSEAALLDEIECILPYYAFVNVNLKRSQAWITFFGNDDLPYWADANDPEWFDIEPQHFAEVMARIKSSNTDTDQKVERDGYIVPLKECANFGDWQDVNTYLHNLMYWESVISVEQSGPLVQRIAWLSQNIYRLQREINECSYSSPVTKMIEKSMEEISQKAVNDDKDPEGFKAIFLNYMTQLEAERRSYIESLKRQEELEKEIKALESRLHSERLLTECRNRFSNSIWEQLKQCFNVPDSNPEIVQGHPAQ